MKKIYFYKHNYLRDRQLDTIFNFDLIDDQKYFIENLSEFKNIKGNQVSKKKALLKSKKNLINIFPLVNIKLRPKKASKESIVYVFGGILLTGKFIVELDNPWALVGHNFSSMKYYKHFLKHLLLSKRCIQIRAISEACRNSIFQIFGKEVYEKSICMYPFMLKNFKKENVNYNKKIKFVFISTQFEIKGGYELYKAFERIYKKYNNCELTIISYLPNDIENKIMTCNGINFLESNISREKIKLLLKESDVLILPTYYDSFGMVVLEALSSALAIISNDVYAIKEMCINNYNGYLLNPPISCWDKFMPAKQLYQARNFNEEIKKIDKSKYIDQLYESIKKIVTDYKLLDTFKKNSKELFKKKFSN